MSLAELVSHPKTFLRFNALWISGRLNVECKGRPDTKVWPVVMIPDDSAECRKDGNLIPSWQITKATSLRDFRLAYFLPWGPNSTKTMVLGDKADLFLTDTMNGCTFAYGGPNGATVTHVNYNTFREEGKPIDQTEIDNEVDDVFNLIGGPTAMLRKTDYGTANFPNVTVIGVRGTGGWRFVYQKRDYTGATNKKQYVLKSVHTVR
jgi:hypothetical protein